MKKLVFLFLSFAATSHAFAADDLNPLEESSLNNTPNFDQQFALLEEEKLALEKEKKEINEKEELLEEKSKALNLLVEYNKENENIAFNLSFLLLLTSEGTINISFDDVIKGNNIEFKLYRGESYGEDLHNLSKKPSIKRISRISDEAHEELMERSKRILSS